MASENPKITVSASAFQQLRNLSEDVRNAIELLQERWPIIRPRLSGQVPPGGLRDLASIAEELAQDERDNIAAFGLRIMDWIEDGAPPYLDSYLGLRQRGGVSPGRQLVLAERDRTLRRLQREWRPKLSAGEAAKIMFESYERYRGGHWRPRSVAWAA